MATFNVNIFFYLKVVNMCEYGDSKGLDDPLLLCPPIPS